MLLTDAVARLRALPDPLPPPTDRIDAHVLGRGPDTPEWVRLRDRPATRDAAALVLLYPDSAGEAHLILTERPGGTSMHAGQVSFPGGKREPDDPWPAGTALREAAEEVGLDVGRDPVTILGTLDVVDVRVSGFLLVPVIGIAAREPALVASPREVAEILRVPVRHFLPSAPIEVVEAERDGWQLRYGAYPVGRHRIWGATARALAQLGAVLGDG
ncbi:MAG: CoA pyrophosphatase [Chloroflexota bacterium]